MPSRQTPLCYSQCFAHQQFPDLPGWEHMNCFRCHRYFHPQLTGSGCTLVRRRLQQQFQIVIENLRLHILMIRPLHLLRL